MALFEKINETATLPTRATKYSAGWDIYNPESQEIKMEPSSSVCVKTGVRIIHYPVGTYGQLFSRSSMAIKQIHTRAGVIDSDYRGELCVILENTSSKSYTIKPGERISQLVFIKNYIPESNETLPERGEGGFGSSGC